MPRRSGGRLGRISFSHSSTPASPCGRRDRQRPSRIKSWRTCVPLLGLALLFLCVWNGETSFAVWACVLLIDLIALGLALTSRSVAALLIALLATIVTAGLWIVNAPALPESVVGILVVVGSFGVFFSTASTFLTRKLGFGATDSRRNVPAIAAAMPFVLLLMLIGKLPVPDPTAVFAVAMLLGVVLLALGIVARTSWIALVALAFTWAVEREWHTLHFASVNALLPLGWYVVFFLIFAAYPYFAAGRKREGDALPNESSALPWAIGALSGFLHFWLVAELIVTAYPAFRNGLLPAAFAMPYLVGLFYLIRKQGVAPASGDARLAWQGGAALFFLSLIFPVQFDREWVTLGWAVEGLALLVLFRSVPNKGLRLTGAGMLVLVFIRLALNPAVLAYHPRSGTPIWNWYLYAYGISCLCLFGGAYAIRSYRETALARVIPRVLYALGAVLSFLLLNIEIADYFSVGPTLTFSFDGNFARDMSYSIAWALFAFALAPRRHAPKNKVGPLCRNGIAGRDAGKIIPARLRQSRPALPHRRVHRSGGHFDCGLVRLSAIPGARGDDRGVVAPRAAQCAVDRWLAGVDSVNRIAFGSDLWLKNDERGPQTSSDRTARALRARRQRSSVPRSLRTLDRRPAPDGSGASGTGRRRR